MRRNTQSIDEIDWFDPSDLLIGRLTDFNKADKLRKDSGYKSNF